MGKRFSRKSHDKVFGGVCSGLADYVGVEVSLVRLLTLVGIIASGVLPGLFLYILCVIIVPNDIGGGNRDSYHQDQTYSNSYQSYDEQKSYGNSYDSSYGTSSGTGNSRLIFGIILIAIGVFLFARMLFPFISWKYIFAGALILGGLYMLMNKKS